LIGQIFVSVEFAMALWAVTSIFLGSKLAHPSVIFPKYRIELNMPIAKASIGVFLSALFYGISAIGVAFVKESFEFAEIKCDVFMRMSVFGFIISAGFTYIFLLVKLQTAKIDRRQRTVIEWMLIIGLLGIPALIVCAAIFLPGHFRTSHDQIASVCVVNTENWWLFIVFSMADWSFNSGFLVLFAMSLRNLVITQKNCAGSEFEDRAKMLLSVAKRNFISCLLCIIPATLQMGMLLYTATTTSTEVAVISESITPVTVCCFVISVIYSTKKAWEFPRFAAGHNLPKSVESNEEEAGKIQGENNTQCSQVKDSHQSKNSACMTNSSEAQIFQNC
jgi:hypothetical protein